MIIPDEKLPTDAAEKTAGPSLRMAELDGLRALAILLVVSFHSWYFLQFLMPTTEAFLAFSDSPPWVFGFIRRGDLGVDIFFVLSGYLLSWQLFQKRMKSGHLSVKRFYAHRIFRICPLYLIALLLAAIDSGITLKLLGNLLAYNIWTDASNIIIPWTWSLSVVLEFYAIVPLLILLVRNGKTLAILATTFGLLTVGWSYWVLTTYPQLASYSLIDLKLAGQDDDIALFYKHLYVSMPVRLSQFTFGMVGAWVVLNRASILSKIGGTTKTILVLLIVIGAALPLVHNPFTVLTDTYRPLVYVELLFGRVAFAAAIAMMIVCCTQTYYQPSNEYYHCAFWNPSPVSAFRCIYSTRCSSIWASSLSSAQQKPRQFRVSSTLAYAPSQFSAQCCSGSSHGT